jgi:glycosyltransferase involved in cell wall biosynthesis
MPRISDQRLRIAQVAPPFLPVPPARYGGTERIVAVLADGLHERGHDVTVFASGDSKVSGKLVPLVRRALWTDGIPPDADTIMERVVERVIDHGNDFDVIHSHIEWYGFDWARRSPIPVVSTLHGRIDIGPTARLLPQYPEIPLVAISDRQRAFWPDQNWVATIHHGLPLENAPLGTGAGGYLLFVGRITPEKGIDAAIDVARAVGLRLFVAAKAIDTHELQHYEDVVAPAEKEGVVRFLGEVGPPARDRLYADAIATLMMGDWPEPFGLVAVESLAAGTPVIARRAGALPEIVRPGVDGFVVESVEEAISVIREVTALDREVIRTDALKRFSADRMIDEYERLFSKLALTPPTAKPVDDRQTKGRTALGVP